MVNKMKKQNRNITLSILGGILMVCMISGSALAASDNVPWPRETEDLYFYGYPENDSRAQDFTTQSGPAANTAYVTGDNLPWPAETQDPYFYGYPQTADAQGFKTQSGATVGNSNVVASDSVPWPAETQDPYFYGFPQ